MSRQRRAVKPRECEHVAKKRKDLQPKISSEKGDLWFTPRSKKINTEALEWCLQKL
jgi:hypothetical protein